MYPQQHQFAARMLHWRAKSKLLMVIYSHPEKKRQNQWSPKKQIQVTLVYKTDKSALHPSDRLKIQDRLVRPYPGCKLKDRFWVLDDMDAKMHLSSLISLFIF